MEYTKKVGQFNTNIPRIVIHEIKGGGNQSIQQIKRLPRVISIWNLMSQNTKMYIIIVNIML